MLTQFSATKNPNNAERTVQACLISKKPVSDAAEIARLAEFAIERGKDSSDLAFFLFARGLSDLRQQKNGAALDWFMRSREAHGGRNVNLNTKTLVYESIALERLGRFDEAKRSLSNAVKAFEALGQNLRGEAVKLGRA